MLAGGYEEAGDQGRRKVSAGDVLYHSPFEAHLDRFALAGATILNIVLPSRVRLAPFGSVDDPDAFVRTAERDPTALAALLISQFRPADEGARTDWPDRLAATLADPLVSHRSLASWAEEHGLSPATVSRGFRAVYGVSPARYRLEARGRTAWRLLREDARSTLAELAAATGFSDQPHMTRTVQALTGRSPAAWRRSNTFKTLATGQD